MRLRVAGVQVVNEDGDGFWSVARGFQHLQANAPEFQNIAIMKRSKRSRRLGGGAKNDSCAHAVPELQMSGDKIGVEVSQEYVLDLERVFSGQGNVLVCVALRINYHCRAARLVSDEVRGVRQAGQIELFEDHYALSLGASLGLGNDSYEGPGRFPAAGILLFGFILRHGREDNHVVAMFPIYRCGDLVLGREL